MLFFTVLFFSFVITVFFSLSQVCGILIIGEYLIIRIQAGMNTIHRMSLAVLEKIQVDLSMNNPCPSDI